jgi:hypothetical protein
METIEVGHKIQAILAEYNALRAEIQQRSDFQHRILQLHITTLTIVLGAAVSQPLGHLIFLLIPITTSLFGLWWLDNRRAIREIGMYIQFAIESKMNSLLKDDELMFWESRGTALPKPIFSKRRLFISTTITSITFTWPSFITLIIGTIMLLPNTTTLNFGPALFSTEWWIAFVEWLAGVFLFIMYMLPVQLQPQYKSKVVATSKQ